MLPPLVMILAIADDVHIVQHFTEELRATGSKGTRSSRRSGIYSHRCSAPVRRRLSTWRRLRPTSSRSALLESARRSA